MQKTNTKRNFLITAALFFLAVLYTLALTHVDIGAIAPDGSTVGFSTVNLFFSELFGYRPLWYDITDFIGIGAVFVAFFFAMLGFYQLMKRKSLLKVDRALLFLGGIYLLLIGLYLFFEAVVINTRPVLMGGHAEASYPSSHVMIVVTIFGSAILTLRRLFPRKKRLLFLFDTTATALIGITVVGRLLSGVHWFSDIVGGLLFSAALLMLDFSLLSLVKEV
ncbi:MAG TPA: phosphoesterase PA-phosphatase [Clostridiales bacterium]|nr:phosphoesterase PA-phosphatase [Clostridiales bacterium]